MSIELGNIVSIVKGKKHDNVFPLNGIGKKRYIQIEDLRNDDNLKYTDETGVDVSESDMIIAWDGANAGTIGFGLNGFIGSTLARLRFKEKGFDTNYLGWFLRNKSDYLRSKCTGATIPHINKSALESLKIPKLDLKTQQEIAQVLEQAVKARQQRKAANALTDQFLQSSFLSLFGDPMLNNKKWKTSHLKELFIVKPSLGTTTPVSEGAKYKIVRVGEIGKHSIDFERCKFVNLSDVDRKRFNLKKGDILLARAIGSFDHLGKASLVQINDEQLVFDSHVMRLRFDQSSLNPIYFYYLLETEGGRKIFLTASSRTAVQFNINSTQISEMKIPVPPLSLQQQFAGIVAQAEQLRQKQRESEKELENLFQGLLQRYFGAEVNTVHVIEEPALSIAAEPEVAYEKVDSLIPQNKKGFAKYVLAGKIIKVCRTKKEMTYIKIQKLQHLAEYMLEEELDLNYYYQAAGPYDNKLMHNLANRMQKQKWFKGINQGFTPLEKVNEIDQYFNKYFGTKKDVFDKLISLLGNAKESQCEIVSTLFAIWNDMLIQKETVKEEEIVNRFYSWSDRKKRYTQEQLVRALGWMKQNNLQPIGFGSLIKHKK